MLILYKYTLVNMNIPNTNNKQMLILSQDQIKGFSQRFPKQNNFFCNNMFTIKRIFRIIITNVKISHWIIAKHKSSDHSTSLKRQTIENYLKNNTTNVARETWSGSIQYYDDEQHDLPAQNTSKDWSKRARSAL